MNRKHYIILMVILGIILIGVLIGIILNIPHFKNREQQRNNHKYITTTIVEKNIEQGYNCGWYCYVPTQYILVSVDKNGNKYTNYVDSSMYYDKNINDTLSICVNHNKVYEYE